MTRPTKEQIDALKPGDRVLVECEVVSPYDDDGDFHVRCPRRGGRVVDTWPDHSAIHSILSREIKVGDRVSIGPAWQSGEVRAIDGGQAWVRHEGGEYCSWLVASLTVIA